MGNQVYYLSDLQPMIQEVEVIRWTYRFWGIVKYSKALYNLIEENYSEN